MARKSIATALMVALLAAAGCSLHTEGWTMTAKAGANAEMNITKHPSDVSVDKELVQGAGK